MDRALVRDEVAQDHDAIREVHRLAFVGDVEGRLVDDLRASGDVILSLVASRADRLVGHVLFSRLNAPMRALALAPIAVRPDTQNRGIGSALIREGLARAKRDGWDAVFVLGEPAYYARFGFDADAARGFECPYSGGYFMMMRLASRVMPVSGAVIYPVPFSALG